MQENKIAKNYIIRKNSVWNNSKYGISRNYVD